jgi:prevent-host-death family protein
VVSCDYIGNMKRKKSLSLYKQRARKPGKELIELEPETTGPMILREAVALRGVGLSIPVRAAKAKFSALLELVAGGQEVTITSDGKPKAKLVAAARPRKVFTGTWEQVKKLPLQSEGPFAEEIIRADRDGRGW